MSEKVKSVSGALLALALVALIVLLVGLHGQKEEGAGVTSVVLTMDGCVAAAEIGIEFKQLPEGTCSISLPGMHKYGDKLYVTDRQIISASHAIAWMK